MLTSRSQTSVDRQTGKWKKRQKDRQLVGGADGQASRQATELVERETD